MASEQDIIELYNPPESYSCRGDRCTNLFPEFVVSVIVPAVVVLLLLMLLAVIMMCSSKSCKCRKYSSLQTQTNDIQMENYNSIRRATANLRLMSQNRETPIMGSRASSMTLDRSQRRPHRPRDSSSSAPGTLQRHLRGRILDQSESGPPPPYSVDLEDSFRGPEFPQSGMRVSARYDDSPDHNGNGVQPLLFHQSYDT
ncbi:unnamed protein product [Candidula unifasciata]|uniref:Uncharacterized protein n=1 Tax=Candidula unifasciata TaxID=100452 RepID=A0A8S3YVD8_9EUPU|nr:unnamed protein product [Candidula unifasciata]